MSETSLRLASVSPSMYRWVIARLVCPASSWTSRRLPPTCETLRPARGLQDEEGGLQVGVHRDSATAGLALAGTVLQVDGLGHLPCGIRDHGPGQGGNFLGAEAGLHRQEKHDAIPVRVAGCLEVPQDRK